MIECLCKQLTEIWWWPCQKHRNFHKNMTKLVFCCSSPAYLGFSHCRGNFSRHVITPTKFNRVHHAWFVTECPFSLLLCRTMYVLQDSKVMRLCDLLVLFLHFQCTIVIDESLFRSIWFEHTHLINEQRKLGQHVQDVVWGQPSSRVDPYPHSLLLKLLVCAYKDWETSVLIICHSTWSSLGQSVPMRLRSNAPTTTFDLLHLRTLFEGPWGSDSERKRKEAQKGVNGPHLVSFLTIMGFWSAA